MEADDVVTALVAGLAAYGVSASPEVRTTGDGTWFVNLDFVPQGIEPEVARRASTVRVLWSGGTVDDASLGQALDLALRDAGLSNMKGRFRAQ